MQGYPGLRHEAAQRLRSLYNPGDYPPVDHVAQQFTFTWQYISFGVPDQLREISTKIWQDEREKAAQVMAEAGREIQQVLRSAMVKHMRDRLKDGPDGKPLRFKETTVSNLADFLGTFEITRQAMDYLIASLSDHPDEQKQFVQCKQRILDILLGSMKVRGGVSQEDDGYGNRFMFHFNPRLVDHVTFLPIPDVVSTCTSSNWAFAPAPADRIGGPLSVFCTHNQVVSPSDGLIRKTGDDPDAIVVNAFPGVSMQNRHTWQAALEAGQKSDSVEDGWRHLGFVLHLAQDLTSPAHVHSDAHPHLSEEIGFPDADPLEFAEAQGNIPRPVWPASAPGGPQRYQ